MHKQESTRSPRSDEGRDKLTWLLVAGLFLLRVFFLAGMRALTWTATSSWVMPIFEVGTYLLTALLIWFERDRLPDSHIDKLALLIIILGKPIELWLYKSRSPFGRPLGSSAYLLYPVIAACLSAGLIIARPRLDRFGAQRWLWLAGGVLAGITLGAFSGWMAGREIIPPQRRILTPAVLLLLPVQQMLYAGIAEEPFFRGFLWGALRRAGWKDVWIWALQAALFWLAHIYWLGRSPVSFWVLVPLGGLVFGILAWRSRSIAVSMVAHGLANGVMQMVLFYRL
jgi:membrane protease YdiL (CAAX protease family)